jgi:hypothetical protein
MSKPRKKSSPSLPFTFILDYLYPKEPDVRPMFGCYGLYLGKKIIFVLRKRGTTKKINGVWIATSKGHHESLKKIFPSMRSIDVLGKPPTNWQMIPESSDDFESSVILACELVKKGDPRIGVVPKGKVIGDR